MNESNPYILHAKKRQTPDPPPRRKCCATCEHLRNDGLCLEFDDYPPVEFIEQENECDQYEQDPPF